MSVDPLVPATQQSYVYAGDNPVNENDPTGQAPNYAVEGYLESLAAAQDAQNAFIAGATANADEVSAYLEGLAAGQDAVNAYLEGLAAGADANQAYLYTLSAAFAAQSGFALGEYLSTLAANQATQEWEQATFAQNVDIAEENQAKAAQTLDLWAAGQANAENAADQAAYAQAEAASASDERQAAAQASQVAATSTNLNVAKGVTAVAAAGSGGLSKLSNSSGTAEHLSDDTLYGDAVAGVRYSNAARVFGAVGTALTVATDVQQNRSVGYTIGDAGGGLLGSFLTGLGATAACGGPETGVGIACGVVGGLGGGYIGSRAGSSFLSNLERGLEGH